MHKVGKSHLLTFGQNGFNETLSIIVSMETAKAPSLLLEYFNVVNRLESVIGMSKENEKYRILCKAKDLDRFI